MLTLVPEIVEEYAAEHSAEESSLLHDLAQETYAKADSPQMQVGRLEGAFLRLIVRITGARRVLELGTFTGYSSLVMAEGLPDGGELITCDLDEKSTAIAKKYWALSSHAKKIVFKLGNAADTLKTLAGPFDLVFIDADKANYVNYWEACLPLVRSGGVLLADNTLWKGKVVNPQDDTDRVMVEFNDHVRNDSRVESVMLTIRDGVTLAFKR
jgi:caffeoyl-CoA O-methyltransferase